MKLKRMTFPAIIREFVLLFFVIGFLFVEKTICEAMTINQNLPTGKTMITTKDDNGKELFIAKGDIIQIELEGLGSTGYWWYIRDQDHEYLELLSEETKPLKEGVAGAPVLGIWKFKTIKQGTSKIMMDYYRVWEGTDKSADSFSITITIQ